MDYVGAVTFVTKDRDWLKKIGIGAVMTLLSFLLVGTWALSGWAMEIYRRTRRGYQEPLADWDDLGGYIGQGLKFAVVTLVWSLPAIILSAAMGGIAAMGASGQEPYTLSAVSMFASLLSVAYGIAVSFLSLGAFVILAETGDLGQAINPANAWQVLSRNLGQWVICGLALIVGALILSTVGTLLCLVGVLFATPWTYAMMGHLIGQTVTETGGEL